MACCTSISGAEADAVIPMVLICLSIIGKFSPSVMSSAFLLRFWAISNNRIEFEEFFAPMTSIMSHCGAMVLTAFCRLAVA